MDKHVNTYRVAVDGISGGNRVVGFIGHVDGDVRLAFGAVLMKRGVGSFMWTAFLREYPDTLTAQVKRDNVRIQCIMKKFGWTVDKEDWDAGSDPVRLLHSTR